MNKKHLLSFVALAAVLAMVPLIVVNPYYLHLIETILIYAVLLLGLDIVVGYTGQVSLGHAGLFGIGAYVVGTLVLHLDMPFWITLPAAVVVTAAFGAILALPALRVTGPYLAMVTLAFGTIIQILINEMDFLTAGPLGISLDKPSVAGHMLSGPEFFWLVLALLALAVLFTERVARSHYGAPSRPCATVRSPATAWAYRSTATKSWPSSSAPAWPACRVRCTPTRNSTFRPTPTPSN